MPRTCTVCRHAEHLTIDHELVGGAPRRALARRYGLSATAVGRHADAHLPQLMARAAKAEHDRGARLLERAERLVADLEGMASGAKAGGDFERFLRVVRELRPMIELLGRATGELSTGGVTVLVAIEQQLGVSLEVAREAVEMQRAAAGIDQAGLEVMARQVLEAKGWTCLPAGSEVATTGDAPNGKPDARPSA